MRLEIEEKGKNTLVIGVNEEENCCICKEKKENMYYCEVNKKIYCFNCLIPGHGRAEHTDYFIHKVKVEK